jgi:hypothetical protein
MARLSILRSIRLGWMSICQIDAMIAARTPAPSIMSGDYFSREKRGCREREPGAIRRSPVAALDKSTQAR